MNKLLAACITVLFLAACGADVNDTKSAAGLTKAASSQMQIDPGDGDPPPPPPDPIDPVDPPAPTPGTCTHAALGRHVVTVPAVMAAYSHILGVTHIFRAGSTINIETLYPSQFTFPGTFSGTWASPANGYSGSFEGSVYPSESSPTSCYYQYSVQLYVTGEAYPALNAILYEPSTLSSGRSFNASMWAMPYMGAMTEDTATHANFWLYEPWNPNW